MDAAQLASADFVDGECGMSKWDAGRNGRKGEGGGEGASSRGGRGGQDLAGERGGGKKD